MALTARSLFLSHGIVCFWKVQSVWPGNILVWFLLLPILTLIAEGLYTVSMRGGEEFNWVSPCIMLYLLCVVPPIWFLEAREYFDDQETHVCIVDWHMADDKGCRYDFGHIYGMKEKYPIINNFLNDPFVYETACELEYLFRYDTTQFLNFTAIEPYDYTKEGFNDKDTTDDMKEVYWSYKFEVTDLVSEDGEKIMKKFHSQDWNRGKRIRDEIRKQTAGQLNWTIWDEQKARDKKKKADAKRKAYEDECKENQDNLEVDEEGNYADIDENHKCFYYMFTTTQAPSLQMQQQAAAAAGLGGIGAIGGDLAAAGDLEDLGIGGDNAELAKGLVGGATGELDKFFADMGFGTRTWIILFHQAMLFILIIGRWMLPKNEKVSRDALSQILLTFIGVAADMLEFVTETGKEVEIKCDLTLLMLILWR